jgi:GT2 family glycosyltransferase
MKASVIIATYGRDAVLVETIRSVFLQDCPDFELLVIDQTATHTPEVESFLKSVDDARYSYYLISPPSLPAARNFGFASSSGEVVVFIDDDVLLEPDFIRAHLDVYDQGSEVAAVGGRVRTSGEETSPHLYRLEHDGSWTGGFDFSGAGDLETVRGCNMSFRRSALEKIGGFDVSYEGNALREESDVCFRLRHLGYKIRFEPRAALDHLVAPRGGCRDILWTSPLYYQNEALFCVKNLGFRHFALFVGGALKNHVLPHKRSFQFWTRLNAFSTGVARGLWRAFFPRKWRTAVLFQSNRSATLSVTS